MNALKTRKGAAVELHALYNTYELKPVSVKTIYNRIFFKNGAWHLIGKAHNYSY